MYHISLQSKLMVCCDVIQNLADILMHFRTGAVEQEKYWGRGLSASKTILAECHYQLVWSVQENFWLNKPTHDTQWPETALNFCYSKLTVH